MILEEKQMMTNEQLEAEIKSARTKETIANVLIYGAGAAMILMFCLKKIPLAILFLVLLLVGGYLWGKSAGVAKKLISENVIINVSMAFRILLSSLRYDAITDIYRGMLQSWNGKINMIWL